MKEQISQYIEGMGVDSVGFPTVSEYTSPNTPMIESFSLKKNQLLLWLIRVVNALNV